MGLISYARSRVNGHWRLWLAGFSAAWVAGVAALANDDVGRLFLSWVYAHRVGWVLLGLTLALLSAVSGIIAQYRWQHFMIASWIIAQAAIAIAFERRMLPPEFAATNGALILLLVPILAVLTVHVSRRHDWRERHMRRLRHAIRGIGVEPGPEMDRTLGLVEEMCRHLGVRGERG